MRLDVAAAENEEIGSRAITSSSLGSSTRRRCSMRRLVTPMRVEGEWKLQSQAAAPASHYGCLLDLVSFPSLTP